MFLHLNGNSQIKNAQNKNASHKWLKYHCLQYNMWISPSLNFSNPLCRVDREHNKYQSRVLGSWKRSGYCLQQRTWVWYRGSPKLNIRRRKQTIRNRRLRAFAFNHFSTSFDSTMECWAYLCSAWVRGSTSRPRFIRKYIPPTSRKSGKLWNGRAVWKRARSHRPTTIGKIFRINYLIILLSALFQILFSLSARQWINRAILEIDDCDISGQVEFSTNFSVDNKAQCYSRFIYGTALSKVEIAAKYSIANVFLAVTRNFTNKFCILPCSREKWSSWNSCVEILLQIYRIILHIFYWNLPGEVDRCECVP